MDVRRCPALPHHLWCSTIGAGGLSFRVRNVAGRFPSAITAVTLLIHVNLCGGCLWVVMCMVDANCRCLLRGSCFVGVCVEVLGLSVPVS